VKRLLLLLFLLSAAAAFGQVQTGCSPGGGPASCTAITSSGGTLTIPNLYGGMNTSFEELITGSPSTVSITIQGCAPGGTCDTAFSTNTSTSNSIVAQTPTTKVYTKFLVTASWTGGTSVSIQVNPMLTTARAGGSGGGGVTSINTVTGAFTFTGSGVSCTSTTCTFSGSGLAFPATVSGTTNSGGIPYFSTSTTLSSSAALTANALVKGGGAGVAPSASLFTDSGTQGGYSGTAGFALTTANAYYSDTAGTAPTCSATDYYLWADSTANRWKICNNGIISTLGTFADSVTVNGTAIALGSSGTTVFGTESAPTASTSFTWPAGDSLTIAGGSQAASTSSFVVSGTPYAGGTATTNFPMFSLWTSGATGPTTWNTAGTMFGINAPSGFTGDLCAFHVNGGADLIECTSGGSLVVNNNFQGPKYEAGSGTGAVTFQGGQDVTASSPGAGTFRGGSITSGTTASLISGAATFQAGDNSATGATEVASGTTVRGGDCLGADANSCTTGAVTIRGGNDSDTAAGTIGGVTITGGGYTGAVTSSPGADVIVAGGLGTGNSASSHVKLQVPGFSNTSGTTAQAEITEYVPLRKAGSTTSATATTMFTMPVASNQTIGVEVLVHVETTQATPQNCSTFERFDAAVQNTGGTITQQTTANGTLATICSTGTLTLAAAFSTASSPVSFSVTPTWTTIVPTGVIITVEVHNLSQQDVTVSSD
jgi:hypothetical protein